MTTSLRLSNCLGRKGWRRALAVGCACAAMAGLPGTGACSGERRPRPPEAGLLPQQGAATRAVETPAMGGAPDANASAGASAGSGAGASAAWQPFDLYYGVYLNGQKVGWMRSQMQHTAAVVTLTTELQARVAGMGQAPTVELSEERIYDAASGRLDQLAFRQEAAAGSVRVTGRRALASNGSGLNIEVTAGGMARKQHVEAVDTLDDALAVQRLVATAKVGDTVTTAHFDPSLLQTVRVEHRIASIEQKMFAGVSTHAVRVDSTYPDLSVTESSWLDTAGTLLESHIGGFFVARIEPPDVAKRLDYQQDLLVSAVVKAPRPVDDTATVTRMRITFRGFADSLPPAAERQRVTQGADTRVVIELQRDPALPSAGWTPPMPVVVHATAAPVPTSGAGGSDTAAPLGAAATDADGDEFLQATPFIQSDAEPIQKAAREAVAGAPNVAMAVSQLVRYVDQHVRDEYVPAYSNALDALTSARGDCTEHSVLFVALARAVGIPARVAVGIAYWPPGDGFGWHAWAEVRLAGRWYAVDPTWGQPIADATHIKLAEGGPADQARIVMLLGRLSIDDLEISR